MNSEESRVGLRSNRRRGRAHKAPALDSNRGMLVPSLAEAPC